MMIVISQPRYLPVFTYIQRLYFADKFVILDNVQRQKRGFENRNKVLVNGVPKWLTIPSKSSSRADISDTKIDRYDWIREHKDKINEYYSDAEYFDPELTDAYFGDLENYIQEGNYDFTDSVLYLIQNLCNIFHFKPNIEIASELNSPEIDQSNGPHKLLEIAKHLQADHYISGLNGRKYGISETFTGSGIQVKYHVGDIEEYNQMSDSFIPHLCFFDPLFNAGLDWTEKMIKKNPILE